MYNHTTYAQIYKKITIVNQLQTVLPRQHKL